MVTGVTQYAEIAMPDGTRLAATLFLPAECETIQTDSGARVPCLLEALPYRKDDLTASYRPEYVRFRDEYGYAVARVDLRGTGSSGGIALDEYHPQELADLHEVIAWLAGQPWCTGAIGMFGTSWSGFNALQMAGERPPALRAIVSSYASDDRWSDDVHYQGGALRLLDLVDYPLYMVSMNGLPPVPEIFGKEWQDEWARRAVDSPPWLLRWLEEQTDGAYWRGQGCVRQTSLAPFDSVVAALDPGYERIGCPTMLITGWADGYRNITYRMLAALHDAGTPVQVLAGPWSHASPSTAVPGPNVDQVPLMVRWWDRWLREAEPSARPEAEPEPPLTVFIRSYAPPDPVAARLPGRWEYHDVASLRSAQDVVLDFGSATVSGAEVIEGVAHYEPALDVGLAAWNSCAGALPWGQPQDQTEDDARSLCLTWSIADGPVEEAGGTVLGHPRLRLRVRPDHAIAFVSAKLSLQPASGRPSLLVDRGLLNLAYRGADPTSPVRCRPGEWVDVELELEAAAFEISPGCTLRLALACADWPNTIAPPGTWSAIDLGASSLVLPVSAGSPYPPPELPLPAVVLSSPDGDDDDDSWVTWRQGFDVLAQSTWAEVDHGSAHTGELLEQADHPVSRYTCVEHYAGRVEVDRLGGEQRLRASARFDLGWPGVEASSLATLAVTADRDTLDVRLDLDVREGEAVVANQTWHRRIRRTWT
jgi:hypothetical protein